MAVLPLDHLCRSLGILALAVLAGCAQPGAVGGPGPETTAVRSSQEQRIGDETHPKILERFGGAYRNAAVQRYVEGIGRRIAQQSEQPNAKWTFTVLDSPQVNAFALPGGYVYVTRGLMAVAKDEAELAGVIGHEIGHVTAGHGALRRDRGNAAQIGLTAGAIGLAILGVNPAAASGLLQAGTAAAGGVLADYSRSDELAADQLGIRYISRAGYDPYAQADFIDALSRTADLDARLAGQSYNANKVGFFASHPANGPRTRRAIEVATAQEQLGGIGSDRGQARYHKIIDNMTYGDSEAQGFVSGRTFSHPVLRFTYTAPENFNITNSSNSVVAAGPNQSRFIMDGDRDRGQNLVEYVRGFWVQGIAKNHRVGRLGQLEPTRINGLEAARGVLPARINNTDYNILLVVVRMNGALYRLTGLAPRGSGLLPRMADAAASFRRLSATEARRLKAKKIDIYRVRAGDSVAKIARAMNVEKAPEARFRVLNGLKPGEQLRPGMRVKIIR